MIRSCNRHIACLVGLAGLVGFFSPIGLGASYAQAPADRSDASESSLPAYYYFSPSDQLSQSEATPQDPSEQFLPNESSLPGNNELVAQETLPSESQLPQTPASASSAAETPAAAKNLLQETLAESRDRTPWLRLIEAEHTAPIRTIELDASGRNLFTAGEDKLVHHWKFFEDKAGAQWRHHASYRWQVQRAELGTILSLISQDDDLFIAGAGADGQQGEIVGLNTQTGAWLAPIVDAVHGHHSPILKMKMLSGNAARRLISMDQKHGISLWQQDPNQGTWNQRWLRKPAAANQFRYAPFDTSGSSTLVAASEAAAWTIDFTDVDNGNITKRLRRDATPQSQQVFSQALQVLADHFRSTEGKSYGPAELLPAIRDNSGTMVTCLAVGPDQQTVAAGDDMGFLYLWNPQGKLALKSIASFQGFRFHYLAFSRDGRYMAAVANNLSADASILHLWRLGAGQIPSLVREIRRPTAISSIAFSHDAQSLFIGNGRRLEIVPTEQQQPPQSVPAHETISRPSQVVFAADLPYRWKLILDGTQAVFDGQAMRWIDATDITWNSVTEPAQQYAKHGWTLASQLNAPGAKPEDWLLRGNERMGRLELDAHYQRRLNSRVQHVAWLKNRRGEVAGVAVTLSGQNDIWVFTLPAPNENTCRLKRVFGGHEGAVLSIDCSPDSRYLISSAEDCTVRVWPLTGIDELGIDAEESRNDAQVATSPSRANWGFDFAVMDGQAIAQHPIYTGPLFVKGMRSGDRLREISYESFQSDGTLRRTTLLQPEEMVAFLNQPRFDLAVRFIFERAGVEVPGFQSYAHWREIASQVVAADRQWAVWTPSGYYDASFNGNSLFGWQINRGLEREPDFYRADRFQAILERPNFMRRLLVAGSIDQAADLVGKQRIGFGDVLQNALAVQPQVKILSPVQGQVLEGRQTLIRAQVTLGSDEQLASAKAFVSGVVATDMKEVKRTALDGSRQSIELTWQGHLPADNNLQIQVLCATRDKLVGADTLRLQHREVSNAFRKPKLFLLAAGVSQYRDSRIPSLSLGASNAQAMLEAVLANAATLYDVVPLALTDSSVTPNVWRSTVRHLESELRDVQADDLIVLFVSGHGLVDEATDQYYFVTANARYSDLVRQNYRDCLSFRELMSWEDIPCRKIAILDTCHSGAIQPLDSEHLKSAVRSLQGDMVLTLTASEGNQLAAEYRGAQASLFTSAIEKTLQQFQDTNHNGLLDWHELAQQVRSLVSQQSLAGAVPQFPTAGPKDLLEVIELPLAMLRPQAVGLAAPTAFVFYENAP
ncbi:MAG: caspase family protein [Pirellulaceae bacterium]|jgi:WD40 repeat protein